jgi:hypothetical protein
MSETGSISGTLRHALGIFASGWYSAHLCSEAARSVASERSRVLDLGSGDGRLLRVRLAPLVERLLSIYRRCSSGCVRGLERSERHHRARLGSAAARLARRSTPSFPLLPFTTLPTRASDTLYQEVYTAQPGRRVLQPRARRIADQRAARTVLRALDWIPRRRIPEQAARRRNPARMAPRDRFAVATEVARRAARRCEACAHGR